MKEKQRAFSFEGFSVGCGAYDPVDENSEAFRKQRRLNL
jgi:hypothetical protein